MGIIQTIRGIPSYTLRNGDISVYITIQGGHLTADFTLGKRKVTPFYFCPWSEEKKGPKIPWVVHILRGDFFCLPFGGNESPYDGKRYPAHGKTANDDWDFEVLETKESEKNLQVVMDLDYNEGKVKKIIALREGEPVIYDSHIITGYKGKTSLGHHHTLQFPEKEYSGYLDITEPITGFTAPTAFENPEAGGYFLLKPGIEIRDRSKIECLDGRTFNLTRYPTPKGFEDVSLFISDPKKDFCYSAISIPEKGYCYFQLKDPSVLAETLLWMSNGGRHYQPWSGRVSAVLGVEEITGYFHYGRKESVEKNLLRERGFKTYVEMDGVSPFEVRMIYGVIQVGDDFKGVEDIVQKDDSNITILGRGGERIDVPCRISFLSLGKD